MQDGAGSQASADVSVFDASGSRVWSAAVSGAASSVEVPASGLAPRDGQTYSAEVRVRSTTGLYGTGSDSFGVSYDPPAAPGLRVEATQDGWVAAEVEAREGDVDTVSVSVWRGDACVASGLMSGQSCIDRVPPLDEPLSYRAVAHAASGACAETSREVTVPSGGFAHFGYGDGWTQTARMAMNMHTYERVVPEVETIQTPGRDLPVTAYGRHRTVEGTVEADVWWLEDLSGAGGDATLEAFRGLAAWPGDVAMRLPRGERRRVSVQVQADRGDVYNVASLAVDWTEVDGGLD